MSDCGDHCPFLNRADGRCSESFSLDKLSYAFDHCFGYYQACSTYLELLVERRVRRARGQFGDLHDDQPHLIQVTVGGKDRHPTADPALVSHASGF